MAERDPWYASWFGEEYLALYPERDDVEAEHQAAFVRELLTPFAKLGRVGFLDLACGTGRHAIVLDGGQGGVVGLDLSAHLLGEARFRATLPTPGYVRGDMRRLPFGPSAFGAVVNFFTSFGYFEEKAEDARALSEVARVLAPGGAFLSDFFNAERVLATLASREEKTIAGQRISIRRRYDAKERRIVKEIAMGIDGEPRTFRESVRAYVEADLRDLHEAAGLDVLGSFGDFDGSPFDVRRSPRLILLAAKPNPGSAR